MPAARPDVQLSTLTTPERADAWLAQLLEAAPWRQDHMPIYGKEIPLPRLTCWMGDPGTDYVYSGIRNRPVPWSAPVSEIRDVVQAATGERYDSVLLNLYRDGQDHMGWHADDEREIDQTTGIASVSLGAVRRFQIKPKRRRGRTLSVALEPGSLLWMPPGFQADWVHRVPEDPRESQPRINLTFRRVNPPSP